MAVNGSAYPTTKKASTVTDSASSSTPQYSYVDEPLTLTPPMLLTVNALYVGALPISDIIQMTTDVMAAGRGRWTTPAASETVPHGSPNSDSS